MIACRVRWDSLWVEALWGLCLRNKKLAHFPEGPRPLHPHTNGDITMCSCFSSAALSGGRLEGSQAHRHATGIPPASSALGACTTMHHPGVFGLWGQDPGFAPQYQFVCYTVQLQIPLTVTVVTCTGCTLTISRRFSETAKSRLKAVFEWRICPTVQVDTMQRGLWCAAFSLREVNQHWKSPGMKSAQSY